MKNFINIPFTSEVVDAATIESVYKQTITHWVRVEKKQRKVVQKEKYLEFKVFGAHVKHKIRDRKYITEMVTDYEKSYEYETFAVNIKIRNTGRSYDCLNPRGREYYDLDMRQLHYKKDVVKRNYAYDMLCLQLMDEVNVAVVSRMNAAYKQYKLENEKNDKNTETNKEKSE